MGLHTRYDGELRERLVWRHGSQVSMSANTIAQTWVPVLAERPVISDVFTMGGTLTFNIFSETPASVSWLL